MDEEERGGNEPIGTVFAELTEDAKAYAAAELGYFRELALAKAKEVRDIALLGSFAMLFAFTALIAIAVGAVMMLAPEIGALAATAIVGVVTLGLAGVLGWLAWTRLTALLEPDS
ncbi:phage holin family protein [Sphingomonas cannabina]|uniref:phage holin family protein n=1 Tax=Sphingomonas cannabina TaxID=2899123 RepID=UPI001F2466B7|nr:phage holin family protein [Sphingomonas cannabina]UIJ43668.1 phage holin family protein [Sphingomonas cannabina]